MLNLIYSNQDVSANMEFFLFPKGVLFKQSKEGKLKNLSYFDYKSHDTDWPSIATDNDGFPLGQLSNGDIIMANVITSSPMLLRVTDLENLEEIVVREDIRLHVAQKNLSEISICFDMNGNCGVYNIPENQILFLRSKNSFQPDTLLDDNFFSGRGQLEIIKYKNDNGDIDWICSLSSQNFKGSSLSKKHELFDFIGIHSNELIVQTFSHKILGIDLTSGNIKWESFYPSMQSDFFSPTKFHIDKCIGKLFQFQEQQYIEFDLKNKAFKNYQITDFEYPNSTLGASERAVFLKSAIIPAVGIVLLIYNSDQPSNNKANLVVIDPVNNSISEYCELEGFWGIFSKLEVCDNKIFVYDGVGKIYLFQVVNP